jgi:hypothetical protein
METLDPPRAIRHVTSSMRNLSFASRIVEIVTCGTRVALPKRDWSVADRHMPLLELKKRNAKTRARNWAWNRENLGER